MTFEKGHAKLGGRKKGTLNVASLVKVDARLLEQGIDPVLEILALLPQLRPDAQLKGWLELLSYCHAKPRDSIEIDVGVPFRIHRPSGETIELGIRPRELEGNDE